MASKRTRGFVFTLYPNLEDDLPWDPSTFNWPCLKPAVQYITCQLEEAPSTKRIHWQGQIEYKHPQSLDAVRRFFAPAKPHIEIRNGTAIQAANYCSKSETCVDPDTRFEYGILQEIRQTKDEIYKGALSCESFEMAFDYIKEHSPRDYVINYKNIRGAFKAIYATVKETIERSWHFDIPRISDDILECRSLFLSGGSGIGKTSYAISHFQRPLLVSHIDDLKRLKEGADGIIFDDMCFKHWPRSSCIHLLDLEHPRTINVKYGTVTIPAKMRRIFTSNESFENTFNGTGNDGSCQYAALYRRAKRYRVYGRLFCCKSSDNCERELRQTEMENDIGRQSDKSHSTNETSVSETLHD